MSDDSKYWVFGYGSLIWHPGFVFQDAQQAVLHGAHRSLCVYSHRYRGTPEKPGLVFGLLTGGFCHGRAFRVHADDWHEVREYLREREQVTGVYHESQLSVRLESGRDVDALVFLTNLEHEQYAGNLDVAEKLRFVRHASGQTGSNVDYVVNTAQHLEEMGIPDQELSELSQLLQQG